MILRIVTTACWTLVAFGQDQDPACLLQNKGAQKSDKNETDSEDVVHASHLQELQVESDSQFHDWFAKFSQNPMGAVNDFSSLPEEQRKHLMSDFSKVPSDVLKTKLDALPEASQHKITLALRRSPLASLLQSDSGKFAAALKDQASEFEESVTSKKDGGFASHRRRYDSDGGGDDGGGYGGYTPTRRRYYVTPTRRRYIAPTRRRYSITPARRRYYTAPTRRRRYSINSAPRRRYIDTDGKGGDGGGGYDGGDGGGGYDGGGD